MMMAVVVSMVMSMIMIMMMLGFLSRSENAFHRISEFLDRSLESGLCCLGRIILESDSSFLNRHLEVLYTFLESHVLADLLCAVLAVDLHYKCNFLDFLLLL